MFRKTFSTLAKDELKSSTSVAYKQELATEPKPSDMLAYMKSQQYQPDYESYV